MNEPLRRLGAEYWEHQLEANPTQALMLGDHRFDDRFEDLSLETERTEIAIQMSFVARARAIDPTGLDPDDVISRDVLIFEATTRAESAATRQAELAVNHTIGLQVMLQVMIPQLPIDEPEHAMAMPAKYAAMGRAIRQAGVRLQEGVAANRTPLRSHVDKTVAQLGDYLMLPAAQDPYLKLRCPDAFSPQEATAWKRSMAEAITDHIRPAWREYRRILMQDVAPAARPDDEPGLCFLPNGNALYGAAIRGQTSVDLDAETIHQIGLEQIELLADEYRNLGSEVLGTTDLAEIFGRLRDDPALHFNDGPSIIVAAEQAMATAKGAMGEWFGRLPKADCVVRETPSGPTAFYFAPASDGSRPGTFFVNTADPTRWGRFEIEAMAFHEGIPGHHLQLAIADELDDVPAFRKHAHVNAYAEGWGLYTERLADEMGLYSSPLDRIGMLSADSMRAGRLVVDTGLHAMGWTRQQAIDYFAANSPMTLGTIEDEVDRYIGMPGQALGYMIGRLEIMKYRTEAEQTLGPNFDIKGFHDTVLGSGLVPLPTLERMIRDWAKAQTQGLERVGGSKGLSARLRRKR